MPRSDNPNQPMRKMADYTPEISYTDARSQGYDDVAEDPEFERGYNDARSGSAHFDLGASETYARGWNIGVRDRERVEREREIRRDLGQASGGWGRG